MATYASGTYAADAKVIQLADAISQDPTLVAKVWNRQLRQGAQAIDDFSHFEGPEGGRKPFVVKKDLEGVNAGDTVVFSVASQPRGPGVRGETELTGNTSELSFATFSCKVDFWRDAVELNKKMEKFLATGQSLRTFVMQQLKLKLGRKRMNDMKMALKLLGSGNTIFPNGKRTFAALTALDTMSPSFLTVAKPQWQRLGGRPFQIGKNMHGSPVYSCMAYIPDCAMTSIRNSTSYENALIHAAERGGANPLYSGRLLDWQGIGLFEHISLDPEADVIADPFAPRAILGTAFGVDTALGTAPHASGTLQLIANSADTKTRFFEFFSGYKYEFWDGQSSDSAWTDFYNHADTGIAGANKVYYAWLINPSDGSVGFVSYAGDKNDGNKITITNILNPDNSNDGSTLGSATVGNLDCTGDSWGLNTAGNAYSRAAGGTGSGNTSADFTYASDFEAGAYIIPANANGVPDICSVMLGSDAAVRCYASEDKMIHQERDYGFVKGGGFETIFGQTPCVRTDAKTHGYALMRHAGQHPGLEVPALNA